jgi:hypothetical protein
MPPPRVPNSVVKLVLELADQQKDPAEIAQMLNLKKVQVSTLLAYHKQVAKKPETEEPTSAPGQASELVVDTPAERRGYRKMRHQGNPAEKWLGYSTPNSEILGETVPGVHE